jgi:hypothetical protein
MVGTFVDSSYGWFLGLSFIKFSKIKKLCQKVVKGSNK